MSFINKFGKTTLASSILVASVLGTTQLSYASGGEGNQGQQGQDGDYMAIGNTKNPKTLYSWSAMVWVNHTHLHIVTLQIILILKKLKNII